MQQNTQTKITEGGMGCFSSQLRLHFIMAGMSRQQKLEAAGHVAPTTSTWREVNAGCLAPFLYLQGPGSQEANGAIMGESSYLKDIEIMVHRHTQRHSRNYSQGLLNSAQQTILWTIMIYRGFCY